jgi:serine/threonine protein kinase
MRLKEKIGILFEIAMALNQLHSAGIIHGDLKPGNILLSSHKDPAHIRLADFGFASLISEVATSCLSPYATRPFDDVRGTPLYSAPEMMFNPYEDGSTTLVAGTSRTTDMYAFAIIAWEVLTGTLLSCV